jgi:hypothetical protein
MKIKRTVVLLLSSFVLFVGIGCSAWEAVNYEIPNGYVGPVEIDYDQKDCRTERTGVWRDVVTIERNGRGCSKRNNAASGTWEHFYYIDEAGRRIRELHSTGWGQGGEIWGEAGSADHDFIIFFVGTEQQFKAAKTWPPPLRAVGK